MGFGRNGVYRGLGVHADGFRTKLRTEHKRDPNRHEVIQAFGTPSQRELLSWENRLNYQIGRLEARFLIRFSEFDGTKYSLVMSRATWRF